MHPTIVNQNTATYIFDYLFKCRIPNLQSMSVSYIKHFGMPTTGNAEIDKGVADQLITTMMPISKMVEYYKEGVAIYIPNQTDVKLIYEYISNHLHAWRQQLTYGLNLGDAPIDDLIAMDAFANTVYEEAKYQFTQEIADSLLLKHLTSTIKYNKNNFFKTKVVPDIDANGNSVINPDLETRYPARESLTDIFKDRKIGKKIWK